MKKLLSTAAICGLAMAATPANAQVVLDVGGYMKGYGFYTDQDDDNGGVAGAGESRELDIVRDTAKRVKRTEPVVYYPAAAG